MCLFKVTLHRLSLDDQIKKKKVFQNYFLALNTTIKWNAAFIQNLGYSLNSPLYMVKKGESEIISQRDINKSDSSDFQSCVNLFCKCVSMAMSCTK